MIVLEIIGELLVRIIVYIIFEGVILGFFKLVKKGYNLLRKVLGFTVKGNK